ncbi:YdcF family protein [Dactylococcopsis salina]|uniref:DUF218 domain-containing protein n=1 Tax=Dactylococcopsis salina (strain PCC 8305) TaxID=13035 RepID=K9YQC2_DACS8|nr:YdcF family protein [Dactylococcopsis salina]AFZ49089.1 hypothetical protein Dacsa_0285 [Dactylococcopsis salina PCC 8305]
MLGGGRDRERFTAEFAQKHPSLPIWISVGSRKAPEIFANAAINPTRIHYDDRATDTVTNFTTIIEPFQDNNLDHVYLITSDFHMRRSRAIATVVFGSRGIIVTPVAVPSKREAEKNTRIARDVVRSLLWVFTKRTGASLNPSLSWLPNKRLDRAIEGLSQD